MPARPAVHVEFRESRALLTVAVGDRQLSRTFVRHTMSDQLFFSLTVGVACAWVTVLRGAVPSRTDMNRIAKKTDTAARRCGMAVSPLKLLGPRQARAMAKDLDGFLALGRLRIRY